MGKVNAKMTEDGFICEICGIMLDGSKACHRRQCKKCTKKQKPVKAAPVASDEWPGYNWLYRKSDGLIYGYEFRPKILRTEGFFTISYAAEPIEGDVQLLIGEADRELDFIKYNVLLHITELEGARIRYQIENGATSNEKSTGE